MLVNKAENIVKTMKLVRIMNLLGEGKRIELFPAYVIWATNPIAKVFEN